MLKDLLPNFMGQDLSTLVKAQIVYKDISNSGGVPKNNELLLIAPFQLNLA